MFRPPMQPSSGWYKHEYNYNYNVSGSVHSQKVYLLTVKLYCSYIIFHCGLVPTSSFNYIFVYVTLKTAT